jgi:ferredoxin
LFFGQISFRERKANTPNARKIAFADGYPLLLISQASLDNLNKHLLDNQLQSVSMKQFRPNIVVDDCLPFAEDGWLRIRIGEVEFKVSKPCERCIFTTVNPQNGEKHPQQQPLRMLKSFRQTPDGEVLFGQNLIALNRGQTNQGDKVTIISSQNPPSFAKPYLTSDAQSIQYKEEDNHTLVTKTVSKNINIFFEKWNKNYQVPAKTQKKQDKPKTLLENGEDAGLILPYSCRAGMCGRCRAKLISGEVEEYTSDGLTVEEKKEGYVLCCSAIAKSDVVIKHE